MKKIQKKLWISEETSRLISEISDSCNMTESEFVSELIRNNAIDIGRIRGDKNYKLQELLSNSNKAVKSSTMVPDKDIEEIHKKLRIMISLLNKADETGYIERDILNALFLYLQPENDKRTFPPEDMKLLNEDSSTMHPFIRKSLDNYKEAIRRKQIEDANK